MSVKRYEVDYDLGKGRTAKTTLKLDDATAERMGLLKPEAKKAPAPANKSRAASTKKKK